MNYDSEWYIYLILQYITSFEGCINKRDFDGKSCHTYRYTSDMLYFTDFIHSRITRELKAVLNQMIHIYSHALIHNCSQIEKSRVKKKAKKQKIKKAKKWQVLRTSTLEFT